MKNHHIHKCSQFKVQESGLLCWEIKTILPERIRMYTYFVTIAIMAFLACSCNFTGNLKEIKADELKNIIDEKSRVLIVDNRSSNEYKNMRIPGAINIPQEQFQILDTLLPGDKSFPIVFYCRGIG